MDPRGRVPLTRHILPFNIPSSQSIESGLRNYDKKQLHDKILTMIEEGMTYRQIGTALGLHWTRVGQIIKG